MIENNLLWLFREVGAIAMAIFFARPIMDLSDFIFKRQSRIAPKGKEWVDGLHPHAKRMIPWIIIWAILAYLLVLIILLILI